MHTFHWIKFLLLLSLSLLSLGLFFAAMVEPPTKKAKIATDEDTGAKKEPSTKAKSKGKAKAKGKSKPDAKPKAKAKQPTKAELIKRLKELTGGTDDAPAKTKKNGKNAAKAEDEEEAEDEDGEEQDSGSDAD